MNNTHIGPVAFAEFFQTHDLCVEVVREKETQAMRNGERIVSGARLIVRNSTDEQWSSNLRPVKRFHRRKFGGLQPAHGTGAEVAAHDLQRDADACDDERNAQRAAMKIALPMSQQEERMDRRNCEARGDKGRQRHVKDFMKAGLIQHCRDRINIGELTINDLEARGRVHPRIGRHDENARKDAAHGHDHSRKPVQKWREAIPAIKIHSNKNCFGEKGEAFQRKWHADNRPSFFHKGWP